MMSDDVSDDDVVTKTLARRHTYRHKINIDVKKLMDALSADSGSQESTNKCIITTNNNERLVCSKGSLFGVGGELHDKSLRIKVKILGDWLRDEWIKFENGDLQMDIFKEQEWPKIKKLLGIR